jgi:hypothetical protein
LLSRNVTRSEGCAPSANQYLQATATAAAAAAAGTVAAATAVTQPEGYAPSAKQYLQITATAAGPTLEKTFIRFKRYVSKRNAKH